ncbi:MAG: O-antigen ligase family protein [Candidatus Acidiferrales bacterium]
MRSQTERLYFIAEKFLVVAALLYFMGAVIPLLQNPNHQISEAQASDTFSLILELTVYAGTVIFIIPHRRQLLAVLKSNLVLCSLLALVLLSCIWSPVALFTLRRAIVFLFTTTFALYFGTRFEPREQIRLVSLALAICVVLSIAFLVVLPDYGADAAYAGAWRGVFFHKNALGLYMVVATVTFLCFHAETIFELAGKWLLVLLSVGLLIGSQSAGSYVVMLAAIVLIPLFRLLHIYWKRLIPAGTIILAFLLVAVGYLLSHIDIALQMLGKDATLTGRIPLWKTVLALSEAHRGLGYGFGGFWAVNSGAVWLSINWKPGKAHNGFIDILLELGVVGLCIFALNTVIAAWRSVKLIARERTQESQWPLLMLSVILLYGLFEINLILPNNFMWIAYVLVTVSTQRAWSFSSAAAPSLAPPPQPALATAGGYEPCPQ